MKLTIESAIYPPKNKKDFFKLLEAKGIPRTPELQYYLKARDEIVSRMPVTNKEYVKKMKDLIDYLTI